MGPTLTRAVKPSPLWHLLQISDVLDLELATALAESVPVLAWEPRRTMRSLFIRPGEEPERTAPGSSLRLRKLPLLRGFSRFPMAQLSRLGPSVVDRLLEQTPDPANSPLICTIPHFAFVAEAWPGPVIYWLTDLIAAYAGMNPNHIIELDRRLCSVATLVCPNSQRLERYLVESAHCDPARITIVPNATRAANLLRQPPSVTAEDHPALRNVPRPIAGVIGNLSRNMDWLLIESTMAAAPTFSWVFVGPSVMSVDDPAQRAARQRVMDHRSSHFVGPQPYGALAAFARAFDVAVLPYRRCEPTYSGSSTRFYEHLAACRPMIATEGLEELTRKPPQLRLVYSAEEAASALNALAAVNFDDGLLDLRWRTSQRETWTTRAETIQESLQHQLAPATRLTA